MKAALALLVLFSLNARADWQPSNECTPEFKPGWVCELSNGNYLLRKLERYTDPEGLEWCTAETRFNFADDKAACEANAYQDEYDPNHQP